MADEMSTVNPDVSAEANEPPPPPGLTPAAEAPAGSPPAPEPVPEHVAEGTAPPGEPPGPADAPGPEDQTPPEPAAPPSNKRWYVVKVQSSREESIKEAIERRVKIEGLEEYFGQIVIPVERVTEMRKNKRVTKERKLYPGYLMVEVEYNDRILYLFRETSGVGDFVGGGVNHPPQPMKDREVEQMLGKIGQKEPGIAAPRITLDRGDKVR